MGVGGEEFLYLFVCSYWEQTWIIENFNANLRLIGAKYRELEISPQIRKNKN